MNIADRTFVSIDYVLTIDSGEEVDRSEEGRPLGFVCGAGQIIPGLDNQLRGMKAGDKAKITIEADDAYGPVREELFKEIPLDQFPDDEEIKPGMVFQAQGPQGPVTIVVKELIDDKALVDFNHPMAGQRLHFDVTVVEVREPTQEELFRACQEGCSCSGEPSDCCPG